VDSVVTGEGVSVEALTALLAEHEARIATLSRERDEYKRMAEFLKRELDRLLDLQKTPREHVDPAQVQLAFAELTRQLLEKTGQQTPSGGADATSDGDGDRKKKQRKHTPHGRTMLPDNLPVETIVLKPASLPDDAIVIGEQVSWRLGFRRASFFRLKLVRPVFVVSKDAATTDEVVVSMQTGDVSTVAAPAASTATPDAPTEPAEGVTAAETPVVATSGAEVAASAPVALPESINGSLAPTTIICAPAPDEMIPRGLPTSELLARVLMGKFADKLPFNRQEGIFARDGVHITRGTMCGWAEQAHALARFVVDAMCDEAKASAHFIATDATGVLVQANEKCKRGHFWVFVADQDHVFYRYSAKQSREEPKTFFRGFRGTVIADASNVYDALFRLPDGPDEAGCNAHARRYFYKSLATDRPRALAGIGFFNRIFELERAFAKLPPSERLRMRQEQSAPVVEKLAEWREAQLAAVAEGTPIRRALNYLGNHWNALTRFLHDGKIPIHNNRSELELRRLVVGRANWLFVGSDESADWTCTFVSLVASCDLHKLDPEAYLRDLFRVLPSWPRARVLELAPKYWARTRARLDPAELALPLGPLRVPPVLAQATAEQASEHPDAEQPVVHEG
jgi:hypothetical protein